MDAISYDFVDRVFTILDTVDHHTISGVQSRLWTDVARIYKRKLQSIRVKVNVLAPNTFRYCLNLPEKKSALTIDDLAHMDDRYVRITEINVQEEFATYLKALSNVENLNEFIRVFSRFPVGEISIFKPHPEFLNECFRHGLKTKRLNLQHGPEARQFLKFHLDAGELEQLKLSGEWPPEIQDDVEKFVCRPEFKKLECNFAYLDMDFPKRIVTYWRSMESPWKSAEVCINTGHNPRRKLEFASWMHNRAGAGRFRETRGDYGLTIECKVTYSKLIFGGISD